ncbi:hypothetical protein RHSIM_Rhsim12G0034100 [Rhododendron simsii]|uniref:Uncharacterized protein n=1 Tax=Rhododendron simsii TaxID=118357 RepID=A0A834L7X8_RHOSS|nr:hypothetical protein RHSIM_Rhsim12G0034100 [Rhododendron simsii]
MTRRLTVKMMDHVSDKKTSGKKFKTAYVLYALCCFLCPPTKDEAGPKLFPGVMDLDEIPHYAWPQFILDWLVHQITMYKNRGAKTTKKQGRLRPQALVVVFYYLCFYILIKSRWICIEGFQLAKRMFIQQVEQIKKTDDILMEALKNKPSGRDESTSDVQNKPSGEQSESDESDGGSERDESDGGEEGDPSDQGEESEGNEGGEDTKCAEKDFEPKGVEPMSPFPRIAN